MSYPYPQDRTRDQRTKGEEPYEEAREAYGESEAQITRSAPEPDEHAHERTEAEQERDAEERFEQIGEDLKARHGGTKGSRS